MNQTLKAASCPDVRSPNNDELINLAREVCCAIEECGASPVLTQAFSLASDLLICLQKPMPELSDDSRLGTINDGALLSFEQVIDLVIAERQHQDSKWGTLANKKQSVAGYLLIARKELTESEDGWMKNKEGRHSALSEMIQVAATAVACLQQHGSTGNPL